MRHRKTEDKEPNEFYPTPLEAGKLALPLMDKSLSWWEPCAGDGALMQVLPCDYGTDLEPRADHIETLNFLEATEMPKGTNAIVTNPPFTLGHQMVQKALFEFNVPVLMFMRVEYMAGKNRMDTRKHLTKMRIVSDLVKFKCLDGRIVNGNGTGRMAWMLFEPDKEPESIELKFVLYSDNESNLEDFFGA